MYNSNQKNVFSERDFLDFDGNLEASFEKNNHSLVKSDNKVGF